MRPAVLIYNPRAGRWAAARRAERLAAVLGAAGWDAEPQPTAGPGDATRLARRAAADGAEAVFAHGGDGTLREAAAGLVGGRTALGFLPGGTANVMRLELGLPRGAEAAARALGDAVARPWDVGLCNGVPFLMQVSAGLDAAILAAIGPRAKRLLGVASVVGPGLRRWLGYGYPAIRLTADGEPLTGTLVVAGNIARYGGPWRMLPAARSDDRRLDLLVFHGRGRAASLGFARDLFLLGGRHARRRDVSLRRAERIDLLGPPGLPVQMDGDPIAGAPPVEIRLAPDRLRLLVPATAAAAR